MKCLFDTDVCIRVIRKHPSSILERIQKNAIEDIGISTITLAELECGIAKSSDPDRNRIALIEFLSPFAILDFGQAAAKEYGEIRSNLERRGLPIGPMDLLIAAHARSENLVLVTNNTREFRRIEGLKVENWL
jgi:tRNA(fMet)-specific endonuclease VapC